MQAVRKNMSGPGKNHRHRSPGKERSNVVLLVVGVFVLLALIGALFWFISSPQFVKPY